MKRLFPIALSFVLLLTATGCFRVSSETRALRDAALDNGLSGAEQKFELGVGMFTVGLAKVVSTIAANYVDIPPEARTVLSSVHAAEVSIHEVKQGRGDFVEILASADRAMEKRGCDRLVGVIHDDQLVAVYIPRKMSSARNVKASVLVINRDHLVCATASADIRDLMELAMAKAGEQMPAHQ